MAKYVIPNDNTVSGDVPLPEEWDDMEDSFESLAENHLGDPVFPVLAKNLLGEDWVEKGKKLILDRTPELYSRFVKNYASNKGTT